MLAKIKNFVKKKIDDIILIMVIILICTLSLAIGFLIINETQKEPLKIEYEKQNFKMEYEKQNSLSYSFVS